jgi:hypothetical protein
MSTYKTAGEALAAARATRTTAQTETQPLTPIEQSDWDRKMLMQLISDELTRLIGAGIGSDQARLRYRELTGLQERLRLQSINGARL